MSKSSDFILPVGTKIVVLEDIRRNETLILQEGMVGVVQQSPLDNTHGYIVRFPDGDQHSLKRSQLAIQKHYRRDDAVMVLDDYNLYDFVIYRAVIGSRAYDLDTESSDTDKRGIYLPPADLHWSLHTLPEQLEHDEEAYWELEKFIKLALKANPNILETLNSPMVEYATPLAEHLLSQRHIFMSKLLYQTYNGYVLSQFKKMRKHLENQGYIRWKHAMHLIRLLISGIEALKTGEILVAVGDYREPLLAIKNEEMTWEQVNEWRLKLHAQFDDAYRVTTLPDRPDYDKANQFLIDARKSMVS